MLLDFSTPKGQLYTSFSVRSNYLYYAISVNDDGKASNNFTLLYGYQLCGDDRACSIMFLVAELKRLSGHVASMSVIQQCLALWCTSQNIVNHCITTT